MEIYERNVTSGVRRDSAPLNPAAETAFKKLDLLH